MLNTLNKWSDSALKRQKAKAKLKFLIGERPCDLRLLTWLSTKYKFEVEKLADLKK